MRQSQCPECEQGVKYSWSRDRGSRFGIPSNVGEVDALADGFQLLSVKERLFGLYIASMLLRTAIVSKDPTVKTILAYQWYNVARLGRELVRQLFIV